MPQAVRRPSPIDSFDEKQFYLDEIAWACKRPVGAPQCGAEIGLRARNQIAGGVRRRTCE
jgi:hypothetical protein